MPQVPQFLFLRPHEIGRTRTSWNASFRQGILAHSSRAFSNDSGLKFWDPEQTLITYGMKRFKSVTALSSYSFRLHANYTSVAGPCRDCAASTLRGNGPQAVQIKLPQGWSAFCTYVRIGGNADTFGLIALLQCLSRSFDIFDLADFSTLQQKGDIWPWARGASFRLLWCAWRPKTRDLQPCSFKDVCVCVCIILYIHIDTVCDYARRTRFNSSAASNSFQQSVSSSTLWQVAFVLGYFGNS